MLVLSEPGLEPESSEKSLGELVRCEQGLNKCGAHPLLRPGIAETNLRLKPRGFLGELRDALGFERFENAFRFKRLRKFLRLKKVLFLFVHWISPLVLS